jgi:glucan phosphoethanolaminetransferase (alkaline phosphatase superfamily)
MFEIALKVTLTAAWFFAVATLFWTIESKLDLYEPWLKKALHKTGIFCIYVIILGVPATIWTWGI